MILAVLAVFLKLTSCVYQGGQEERCPPNEQPTDCVNPCLTCDLRGRCLGRPPPCRPGCDCRTGYFRETSTGECVPASLCTSEQRAKCPAANSAFLACGPGCEPSCEDPEPEPELCSGECVPGCYCLPGFYRTHEGSCVPPQQCEYPSGGECKADEQYYEDCPPRCNTCENHASGARGRTGGPYCACGPPGCFCAEGLVLRADGRCVKPQHCSGTTPELPRPPPKCPEYAEFQVCGNPCPPTCENRNPGPCKLKCIPECHCKPGYLRLRDRCVPEDQCDARGERELPPPPPKCPEYAEFLVCGNPCPPTCENRNPGQCKLKCIPECHCKAGYLRLRDRCVPEDQCDTRGPRGKQCPPNEQYYDIIPDCKNTCENFANPGVDCAAGPPGCFCKEGLVKRKDGQCVTLQQCTDTLQPQCPEHAHFLASGPACPETCEKRHPRPCTEQCVPGCFCKRGYLKLKNKCVPEAECETKKVPKRCEPDQEYYEHVPSCKNTCENHNNPGVRCPPGPPGCFCKTGLVKRKDGKCVNPRECPAVPQLSEACPSANEVFIPCGPPCPPTCEDKRPPPCRERCVSACYCKPGFLRNKEGKCVHVEECFPKVPINRCLSPDEQFYDRTPNCKNTCENHDNPNVTCSTRGGPPGCFCKAGLVKRQDGKCVTPQQCPAKCLPDEQYYDFVPDCKNTCEHYDNPLVRCRPGPPGCFCKEGLVKRQDGRCVTTQECPAKCLSDEQFYASKPDCKNTCKNYNNPGVRCISGLPGCFCKEGLVKRQDGKCVSPQECPAKCPPEEQYYESIPDCKNTCQNFDNPGVKCIPGPPGCFCREGLVKRQDGKCVNPRACSDLCPPDQQYYVSIPDCKNTCDNVNNTGVRCPIPGPPGCFCREGLVKRIDGKCVSLLECPVKCLADEQYYESIPDCKNTCENHDNQRLRCNPGPPGCFCRRGLVKRQDGRCVGPQECPAKCQPDEQYYASIPNCKNTCENFDNPGVRCPIPGPPGCFCREGLVKRQDGKCVNPRECSVICPPDQQYYASIPNCKNTCENVNNTRVRCPLPGPPGCFCREGLVKRNDGKCVTLRECPATCPPDEQYYEHIPDCKNTCENLNNPGVLCRTGPPGCFCKEGLVKGADGKCVTPTECPAPQCERHEQYYASVPSCKNTCENYQNPRAQCLPGPPGCFCREGLVKRKDGRCVLPRRCRRRCPPYEQFYTHMPDCKNTCENFANPEAVCQPGRPGCFCRKGLVKRNDGRCVRPLRCPVSTTPAPAACQENAVFIPCGSGCPPTCEDRNPGRCVERCVAGCFCKPGFLRTKDNRCVLPEQCGPKPPDPKCPEFSVYLSCGPSCPVTCEERSPRQCPKRCVPGCFCLSGYLKNGEGRCVVPEQCGPTSRCKLPEEVFLECGPTCPDTCDNRDLVKPPRCNRCAPSGCFCKRGLLRSTGGACISPDRCPQLATPPTPSGYQH